MSIPEYSIRFGAPTSTQCPFHLSDSNYQFRMIIFIRVDMQFYSINQFCDLPVFRIFSVLETSGPVVRALTQKFSQEVRRLLIHACLIGATICLFETRIDVSEWRFATSQET